MGNYCTLASMATRLMGTNISDTETAALVSENITDAENEINKYLSKRYDVSDWVSVATTPPIVKTWCKWLAAGYYYQESSRGSKEGLARGAALIKRATDNLKSVADGSYDILLTSGAAIVEDVDQFSVLSTTEDYASTFNEDTSTNWAVDSDKLIDIASERS